MKEKHQVTQGGGTEAGTTSRRGMNVTGQGYWAEAKARQGKSGDFITGAAVGQNLSTRQGPCTAGQWAPVFQAPEEQKPR